MPVGRGLEPGHDLGRRYSSGYQERSIATMPLTSAVAQDVAMPDRQVPPRQVDAHGVEGGCGDIGLRVLAAPGAASSTPARADAFTVRTSG